MQTSDFIERDIPKKVTRSSLHRCDNHTDNSSLLACFLLLPL